MKVKTRAFKNSIISDILDGDCPEGFAVVEEGDWVSEGKHQYQTVTFSFDGRFYEVTHSRSGSYHSDYYYETEDWDDNAEQDCVEVERREVIKYSWVPVKA